MGIKMKKILFLLLVLAAAGVGYWAFLYQTPEEKNFIRALNAAKEGNVAAQLQTADFYAAGTGTKQDGKQAVYWYRQAALEGDPDALWKCAQAYTEGKLVPQDLEEAVPFLMLGAKQGNIPAQEELSRFYAQGLGGLVKHEGESLYWQFIAAKIGSSSAQAALKQAQQHSPQLYESVEKFLTDLKTAQEGDGSARLAVGEAYLTGNPILQNTEEAEKWLTLAWQENKLSQAGLMLAQAYQNGPLSDAAKANRMWNELAKQAYAPAQYALGEKAYQSGHYDDAFAWFSNAAAGGFAQGQYMTGFMLMQGQGTAVSVPLAVTFFRSAAEQENVPAQYVLGQIYWKGLGVPQDKKVGKMWLEKAAMRGNKEAQTLLESE